MTTAYTNSLQLWLHVQEQASPNSTIDGGKAHQEEELLVIDGCWGRDRQFFWNVTLLWVDNALADGPAFMHTGSTNWTQGVKNGGNRGKGGNDVNKLLKRIPSCQVVVEHALNSSAQEAEEGGFL